MVSRQIFEMEMWQKGGVSPCPGGYGCESEQEKYRYEIGVALENGL